MHYNVSYKYKMVEKHIIEATNPTLAIQRTFSKDHDISGEYDRWVEVKQARNTPAKPQREKAWHLRGSESSAIELESFVEITGK